MANTTNFGWETPDDTDLVKDGAAAMRTLGNAIDTSLVDLKGGTTGQILSKASNTDLDYSWITNDVGDITEVAAGTGISGGGTSGSVTITNSMATAIDAKGDIVAGTGADTFTRLAVGSNNTFLVAASGETTGLKWVGWRGCYLYKSGNQTITNNTATNITFDSESLDTDAFHSTSSNTSRITIPTGLGGKYRVDAKFVWDQNNTGYRQIIARKNNADIGVGTNSTAAGYGFTQQTTSFYIDLAAADYLEVQGFQNSGGNLDLRSSETSFMVTYLGA